MDKQTLERHLELAERHVRTGERLLARQRAVLGELRRDGHDTLQADRLLVNLEQTQALHVADRDRVKRELAQLRA